MKKFRLLEADEIECKIKKVQETGPKAGITLLLYKTARTDMDLLDETVGPENWQNKYGEIKGNLYCDIGIKNDSGEWIWKSNCGTESRADGEGNEKKGEASDAMKRAGFAWGIGRELYTAPAILIPLNKANIYKGRCYDNFVVEKILYDEKSKISALAIRNETIGKRVFVWQAGESK